MNKIFSSLLIIFITQSLFAAYITNDIVDGCNVSNLHADNNNITNMFPAFTISQYTCSSGSFLPAYTEGCRSCPTGYTCNGGTFNFNETETQGLAQKTLITQSTQYTCSNNFLRANNNTSDMLPVFAPNQHTCTPGYYLPAGVDECTICPQNNKCIGGTYTFNETTTQGIEPCPNGTYAPGGTAYCYEHILHVGDDVVYLKSDKLTIPSLNIGMNDGIFYANMTTEPTLMNKDSEHYLKLEFNNTVYYVCDDTTLR